MKVLVVDDDAHIRELAGLYLEKEGYHVDYAGDGKEALLKVKRFKPDAVVLDVMLPGVDGFEVCRTLRRESDVPILMLTARDEEVDKVVGLELGADDYLTKPFSPRELTARVKAVLRRSAGCGRPRSVITVGGVTIDKGRREVRAGERPLELRAKEFDLLATLAEHAGIVLTRQQLLDLVWGYDFYGETRTVDVHIQHLRAKLAGTGVTIQTLRGVGYKLTADNHDPAS